MYISMGECLTYMMGVGRFGRVFDRYDGCR